jgi:hypothetical protein
VRVARGFVELTLADEVRRFATVAEAVAAVAL